MFLNNIKILNIQSFINVDKKNGVEDDNMFLILLI